MIRLPRTIQLIILLAMTCQAWSFATGAQVPKLAIIPLTVHAEQDLAYLSRGATDMLASRIAAGTGIAVLDTRSVEAAILESGQPINQTTALTIGKALKADYVLLGSITRMGDQFSLDVTAIEVAGKTAPASFFGQAAGMNNVIPSITAMAEKINRDLFAARSSRPAETTVAAPPETQSIYAHPETLLADETASRPAAIQQPPTSSADSGKSALLTSAQPTEPLKNFWKSPDLDMQACGLDIADVDGDGKNEVIIISSESLSVRRLESGRFYKVAEYQAAGQEQLLTVDAVDTDNDGRAEIFVTCLNGNSQRLCSFVMSLAGSRLDKIAEKQNWYFRSPGNSLLLGQKKGLSDIFLPGISRLAKNGAEYAEQEKIELPQGLTVFSFCQGDANNDGQPDIIVMDESDRLRIYNNNREMLWKSDEQVGGSEAFLVTRQETAGELGNRMYLPQRVIVADVNADGRNEVLTVANKSFSGRLFQQYRRYSQAAFVCLAWDGLGLSELWRTSAVSGYASDFALADIDNDGKNDLVAIVVSSRQSLISKPRSAVISYDCTSR